MCGILESLSLGLKPRSLVIGHFLSNFFRFREGLVATVIELDSGNQYVIDLVQSNSASKERNIANELIASKMVRPTSRCGH